MWVIPLTLLTLSCETFGQQRPLQERETHKHFTPNGFEMINKQQELHFILSAVL